jgi:3-oxoacyl-[acyl-carrier-protein] synthase II
MTTPHQRVVVTGCGALSPLGTTAAALVAGVASGRSGIRRVARAVAMGLPVTTAGEVEGLPLDTPERELAMSRRPIAEALAQSGLPAAHAGLLWTTGLDSFRDELEAPGPTSAGARFAALAADFRGPRRMIATACAAATQAIGEAFHIVRAGRAPACVAGGATALVTPFYLIGFSWLQVLAPDQDDGDPARACRPFDRQRRGFALAEGGAALVLEPLSAARARGAPILAEIVGYGTSQDAHDLNRPPPDGAAAELCMRRALDDAHLSPDAIVAVNAHATGTRAGDPAEAAALRRLLGARWPRTPVSSAKGALGHSISAAGALEAIVAISSCRTGVVPPTVNLEQPDDDCALDHVVGAARTVAPGPVLSCSFGMGGQNAALIFAPPPATRP